MSMVWLSSSTTIALWLLATTALRMDFDQLASATPRTAWTWAMSVSSWRM